MLIFEERAIKTDEYNVLRKSVGWWDTEQTATQTALKNTLYSLVVSENENVIGFGRIIGDNGLYYYVQDLIIHPSYQGKGIGRKIMDRLLDYINSNAQRGAFVGLMAARGLENYYKEFGFKPRPTDGPGMFFIV